MLTILLLLISFARADDLGQQVCSLKGEIVLSGPTELFCMKDMKIADGTHLITQGYPLTITAVGSIAYGESAASSDSPSRSPGLRISSFKTPAPQSHAAGPIYIYANTAYGNLVIQNRGASEKDVSGDVSIEYVKRGKAYSQTVDVAPGAKLELIVNGFKLEPTKLATGPSGSEPAPVVAKNAEKPLSKPHPGPAVRKMRIRRPRPAPATRYEPAAPPAPWNWSW